VPTKIRELVPNQTRQRSRCLEPRGGRTLVWLAEDPLDFSCLQKIGNISSKCLAAFPRTSTPRGLRSSTPAAVGWRLSTNVASKAKSFSNSRSDFNTAWDAGMFRRLHLQRFLPLGTATQNHGLVVAQLAYMAAVHLNPCLCSRDVLWTAALRLVTYTTTLGCARLSIIQIRKYYGSVSLCIETPLIYPAVAGWGTIDESDLDWW